MDDSLIVRAPYGARNRLFGEDAAERAREVREEWELAPGGSRRGLKWERGPDLLASASGGTRQATSQVARKRKTLSQFCEPRENADHQEREQKEDGANKGLIHGWWEIRVNGNGGVSPSMPVGAKMHIAGTHASSTRLTRGGMGGRGSKGWLGRAPALIAPRGGGASRWNPGGGGGAWRGEGAGRRDTSYRNFPAYLMSRSPDAYLRAATVGIRKDDKGK